MHLRPLPSPLRPHRFVFDLSTLRYLVGIVNVLANLDTRTYVQRAAGLETGVVGLVAMLKRRRFVYSSANVIDFNYGRLERNRGKAWLFHLGIRLACAVVVQTEEQVELCRRRFKRSPKLIRSVAEPAAPRASNPAFFLWVGRQADYKRPEAFLEVARRVPEARFAMVAVSGGRPNGKLADWLRREAAGIENLELLEPRPHADLMRLVDKAVAMVNTADYEGMPNVFLESWARGVPALSLTHDPDGVIERHGLGGFARGSIEQMAEIARRMWHERADQSELSARCRSYVEREHAPDVVIGSWLGLLEALNRRPPGPQRFRAAPL